MTRHHSVNLADDSWDGRVLRAHAGPSVEIVGVGVRFVLTGDQTGERFSLVEQPIAPRTLAAPLHTHSNEDEYSHVLEGRIGVQIADETIDAGPGDVIAKPRGVPHAFWNAGDEPARVLEIISPAGLEHYFVEAATLFGPHGEVTDPDAVGDMLRRYRIDLNLASVPVLMQRHRLVLPMLPAAADPAMATGQQPSG